MPRLTPDLRTLGMKSPSVQPIEPDFQQIVLKRWAYAVENEYGYYLMHHRKPELLRLWEDKSLHYATHSHYFGIAGPPLLQLGLAICLRLYPVSRAINFHRDFVGKYMLSLPQGNWIKQLIVPVCLCLFMLSSCSQKTIEGLAVPWVIEYQNNVRETLSLSPAAKLTDCGCVVNPSSVKSIGGPVVRCGVRKIERIPVTDYGK